MRVGILGREGHGKTTLAGMVVARLRDKQVDAHVFAFADPLKAICRLLAPRAPLERFYGTQRQKEASLEGFPTGWTGRLFMKKMGTEVGRSIYPNIWVDYARHAAGSVPEHAVVVFDDVRFPNEAAMLLEDNSGLLVAVDAATRVPVPPASHASEQPLWETMHEERASGVLRILDNNASLQELALEADALADEIMVRRLAQIHSKDGAR